MAVTAPALSGQTNAIQLFGPANVRTSTQGTGYGNTAKSFNTKMLNLSCPSPVHATISSSPDGNGNVLIDNYISLSVASAASDICRNGTEENGGQKNCFTSNYADQAKTGSLNGQDPDTFVTTGGVPPIDISSHFTPGTIQAEIGTVDTGGFLTSSSLYLVTNCTNLGITGPGQITGNPIPGSNPTDQLLSQGYPYNTSTNQQVEFDYDLSNAQASGKLSITDGATPSTADIQLDPTKFSSTYLHGTSFATANCLVHTGELFNGLPACTVITLTCQIGTNPDQKGVLCPKSQERNEIFQEGFDGPSFTLPDVAGTDGHTFHQGVGLLEAKDGWGGGSCIFDPLSSLGNSLCPYNVLTNFSGPGFYTSGGSGQDANSAFITVAPVPEDLTTVSVTGQRPGYWINSHDATANFVSTPPAIGSPNSFVAAPIQSLTYGISSNTNVPKPGLPVAGDISIPNSVACPVPTNPTSPKATAFSPQADISIPADGQYLLHYFAQDCAGTEELKFTQTAGSWSTSFYTFPINVDTVAPVVLSGPTLSPAPSTNGGVPNSYLVGQKVSATYRCTDDRSGIVKCGTSSYAPGTKLDTGNITSPIDTSKTGPATFTVKAVDAAGNEATTSVSYRVVTLPPVNLFIQKEAPERVERNEEMTYRVAVFNLGKQTASAVAVTDPLPQGVTFVRARVEQESCDDGKCSSAASCTFANNTVSCTTASVTFKTPLLIEIEVRVQAKEVTKNKNTATVSSANPEGSPGNTSSTAITVVGED
jgi:uncharacterized repeat protein (TIGR01451 family)